MAKIDDILNDLETEMGGATSRIQEDVTNYEGRIAALQAKIDAGLQLTPDQQARFDALKAGLAAIDPTNPNVLPPPPEEPPA